MNRLTTCALVLLFALPACGEVPTDNKILGPDASVMAPPDNLPDANSIPEPEPEPEPFVCGNACTESGGVCLENVCMQKYDLGFPDPFDQNVGGPLTRFIFGFAIDVEATSLVTGMGFVGLPTPQSGNTADAQIALYSDNAGVPAELIWAMEEVENMPPGFPTSYEESLQTPIQLEAGQYWLMGKASSDTSPFASNLMVNNSGFPNFPMAMANADSSAAFPESLQEVNLVNNHAPNFFLRLMTPE